MTNIEDNIPYLPKQGMSGKYPIEHMKNGQSFYLKAKSGRREDIFPVQSAVWSYFTRLKQTGKIPSEWCLRTKKEGDGIRTWVFHQPMPK